MNFRPKERWNFYEKKASHHIPVGASRSAKKEFPHSKRFLLRNDFLGSQYSNVVNTMERKAKDSPEPLHDNIPLAQKEKVLYSLDFGNYKNSLMKHEASRNLQSLEVSKGTLATLDK